MSTFMAVPPPLPPLIELVLALGSLWLGWRMVRTRAIPPLLEPLLRLNSSLTEALQGEGAARRQRRGLPAADVARVYGYACLYAGTFGLIIAGGQLARLIVR